MNQKLVVMDYFDSSITIYDYEPTPNIEEMIEKLGHNLDECTYMVCEELTIKLTPKFK